MPIGIVGVSQGEIDREVPASEPPALAPNADLAVVGKPVPRVGGRAMVTGAARYTVDVKLPGMLIARILRSPYPHARILSVDTSAAERYPGVRAVHVVTTMDTRAAARGTIGTAATFPPALYVGASLAAVAATTQSVADEAIRLLRVKYEVLPFVVDMDEARRPEAPLVFGDASQQAGVGSTASESPQVGNVRGPATANSFYGGPRGNVEQGFREADVTVDGEFRTQVQTHCCLEPHAVVADWRDDGLTLYISTQDTAGVRKDVAAAFGLPLEKVRVITEFMGGGFGSKLGVGDYVIFAVELSRKASAPVSLIFDRDEEQLASGNRPGTWQRLRIGARRDGALTAISLLSYGTAGIAAGAGVGNIAQAMYDCPNFEMAQYDVFVNAGPGCAMRAPGNVQGAFALEQSVDELAEKLGIDPIALRDRIDPSAARREERRIGAAHFGWSRRRLPAADAGPVKRGIGMAQSFWPGIVQTSASCEVRLHRDGLVEVRSSVQDIGTGIRTVLAQVVAEELGLRPEDVSVRIGDTNFPLGPSSGGSKTTGSITPAARKAAYQVRQALFAEVAAELGAPPEELTVGHGRIFLRANPAHGIGFRQAAGRLKKNVISAIADRGDNYGGFLVTSPMSLARENLGGVQFAEVSVDTETGIVRVARVVAVHDCGRPMNPRQIESQIHGGVLMGVSLALYEDRILDRQSGRMLNADLEHYKLAGPREMPSIDVFLIENYQAISATDACGVAEPATIATAAAVANAVYNAIGVRIRNLPMTPASILGVLGRVPGKG
jgi:xanthine dehydrogenase YagR molybdenum-binding subunit